MQTFSHFRKLLFSGVLTLGAVSAGPAGAATGNVTFTGAVLSTCSVVVGAAGLMMPSADSTVLGSRETGGTPGAALVTTTGTGFSLSVDAPTAFTLAPATGGDNVTFEALYSATGVTSVTDIVGSVTTLLSAGITNVSVDLTATKSSGAFVQGAYTAEAVVRCE